MAEKPNYAKPRRHRNKRIVNSIKSEIGCNRCKLKDPTCLDFHHKDPSQKKMNVSALVRESYSINTIFEEIIKCKILCSNCHRILEKKNYGKRTR